MTWYAVHDANGKLVSVGTLLTDTLPAGLTVVDLGEVAPDLRAAMWNEATRTFVPRPAKVLVDRLDDLRAMPGMTALWNSLGGAQRAVLANALITLLGRRRYRSASQSVALEPED